MWRQDLFWSAVKVFLSLLLFFFSIDLLGEAFQHLGINAAESIIFATSNPFIGLFIGLLITAIIQSSSTSTSMIVALVASGSISISDAVPMVMGANIGTTITSTIVSLGFMTKANEFRKGLSAAIIHDFFNVFTVIILFPLELSYGLVSKISIQLTDWLIPSGNIINSNYILLQRYSLSEWFVSNIGNSFILIVISFILLFASIKFLADNLSDILIGKSKDRLKKYFFQNPFKAFTWGTLITAAIQSSSITTSLVVPLAAKGKVLLKNAAPFIMGANIGTTITAFIAALFKSNAALSIAIAHLLINLTGVLIFLLIPYLRHWLVYLSGKFGKLVIQYRLVGLLYILLTFFIIPFTLIYFNRENTVVLHELTYETTDFKKNKMSRTNIINKKTDDRAYAQWLIFNEGPGYDREAPNEVFNVFRKNNLLFINDSYYFINRENFCWEAEGTAGDYRTCIEKIFPHYELNDQLTFDSVFVYKRSVYNKTSGDSLYIQEYIDVNDKMLLIKRRYNRSGEMVSQKKLLDIKEL